MSGRPVKNNPVDQSTMPRSTHAAAQGVADPNAAGLFAALVRRAGTLAPADADAAPPTVLIETAQW